MEKNRISTDEEMALDQYKTEPVPMHHYKKAEKEPKPLPVRPKIIESKPPRPWNTAFVNFQCSITKRP